MRPTTNQINVYNVRTVASKMASMREKKPPKGILKRTSSLDQAPCDPTSSHTHKSSKADVEWDEMNILATLHPADKDYGHMKIDEPPTPYNKYEEAEEEEGVPVQRKGSCFKEPPLDPSVLASMLAVAEGVPLKAEESLKDEEEEEAETEEQKEHRLAFEMKRKIHYNEFAAVQLAKKLMAEEEEDEVKEEDSKLSMSTGTPTDASTDRGDGGTESAVDDDAVPDAKDTTLASGSV